MSDLDFADNVEGNESSGNGIVSGLGIVGAVQDRNEKTPDLLSLDAHDHLR